MKKTLALVLALAMLFSVCAVAAVADAPKSIVVADDEWYGTDAFQQDTWSTIQTLIADPLFAIDPVTGGITDSIATDLQVSEDGLTLTFTIPEGMYYATGEQVEPEDIKASFEYGAECSPYADGYENIESIDVDGRQVTFHLSNFRSDLFYYLIECFICIIDKDQLDTMSHDELMWGAVPYGLYYVEDYEPGSFVTLKPNPGYKTFNPNVENKGPAMLDEVYVKFGTDDFTAIEELKDGTLHYWSGPSTDAIMQLQNNDDVVIEDKTYPVVDFMEINTDNSIFEDINLRKALCLLINREKACELADGQAVPAYAMIYDSMMYFSQAAKDDFMANYANDVDTALALIAESGWADTNNDGWLDKDGQIFEFTMYGSTDSTRQLIIQALQEQLRKYGIKLNNEAIDWNYVHEMLESNEYDAGIHSLEWAEPILILDCMFDDPNAANNTDELYDMIDDIAATVNDAERVEKIGKLQTEVLFPEWNMIPVYSDLSYIAYSADLLGVNIMHDALAFVYWNDLDLAD